MKINFRQAGRWVRAHNKSVLAAAAALAVLGAALGIFRGGPKASGQNPGSLSSSSAGGNDIDAWAEVKYTRSSDIFVDFPSAVTGVDVQEGERVTLGQPLVKLDLSEYQQNLVKLKNALSANQAGLPAASQDVTALQADIAQTQSTLNREKGEYDNGTNADLELLQNSLALAQKDVANAQRDLKTYQTLYSSGAVAKTVVDQYTNALDQKQKALTDVQDNLQKTRTALRDEINQLSVSLKSKQSQLQTLQSGNSANLGKQQAGVVSAQADLNIWQAKMQKDFIKGSQIVSNVKNGIVQNISVADGDRLGVQNQPVRVLQIIDTDSLYLSTEVDEEFIGNVKIGENVRIVPISAPNATLTGTVTQVPSLAQDKDGKRVVRVVVKPQDPKKILQPGYTADVYFTVR